MAATGFILNSCQNEAAFDVQNGIVKITITNTVKGAPLVLNTTTYTNPFAETYTISKFKYYLSNMGVTSSAGDCKETNSYHLADVSKPESLSFTFKATPANYQSLFFMLGVDSTRNVSGAQTGALDPTNDMFWTWSTGYIMYKFEGNSPVSSQVNNKVEYHIGGFAGPDKVLKNLVYTFPNGKVLSIRSNKISEIKIEADLDKLWQTPNDIKIAVTSACMTPGPLSKKFADNYSKMFTITDVINY